MIVIPMAGLSSRFKKAGYKVPKYKLEVNNKTLFEYSLESFEKYFKIETFLFIALQDDNIEEFINIRCKKMKILHYKIILLEKATKGQADTVFQGLENANVNKNESLLIFNIDTFRPNFTYPTNFSLDKIDGYLETFVGSGKNWSNVLPKNKEKQSVKLTAEKEEISKYCCTGLYFWKYCQDFCNIFKNYLNKPLDGFVNNELYIAPMYNDLIKLGKDVRYSVISSDDVIFCGVPEEYELFKESYSKK